MYFDEALAAGYASRTQKIRVMSEDWAAGCLYCPQCGSRPLRRYPHNARAADLFCSNISCSEQYELKSSRQFGRKIVDGAYHALLRRLKSVNNPNLILLTYHSGTYVVEAVRIIPRLLFTPSVIEPRTPLSSFAKRAGWQGCNIVLERIPAIGLVHVIERGVFLPEVEVRLRWSSLSFLRETQDVGERTWLLTTLRIVEGLGHEIFSLADIYRHEAELAKLFPRNRHIRPKLRQQLQRLRDAGQIEFLGTGQYRRLAASS